MVKLKNIFFLLFSVVALASCGGVETLPQKPLPELTWPGGSEIQRIKLVGSISSPVDLGITPTFIEKVWNYITGAPDQFIVSPYGVEVDQAGSLYVVDTYLRTVHVFNREKKDYRTFEVEDSPLLSPIDIAIDSKREKIYVTDSRAGTVRVFTEEGKKSVGEVGQKELQRPTGIAINPVTDELLVLDTKKSVIYRFDLTTHEVKGHYGSNGADNGQFNFPTNIFATPDGTVLVTDSMNFRVQIFTGDGQFIGKFGQAGDTPGFFSKPKGIASDSDGNIYVVDALHDAVQIFNRQGQLLMDFGRSGYDYGRFWLPSGIYIDREDKIYVSDTYNKRIQIFQYLKQTN